MLSVTPTTTPVPSEEDAAPQPVAKTTARRFRLHRPGAFTLLWSGSVISQLGSHSVGTATPLLALAFGASPIVIGWLVAAGSIPGLLLHLPAGLLADRFDRWKIMWISQLVRVVNGAALAAALCVFDAPTTFLVGAAVIDGTATVFYALAEIAAVRLIVPDENVGKAMADNEARQHIALILGRPVGGFLLGLQRTLPFSTGAVTSLVSIGTLILMRKPEATGAEPAERRATLRPALDLVAKDNFLRTTIIACALGNMFFQTVVVLLYTTARQQHLSSSTFGLLLAVSGACGLAGAIVAPRILDRCSTRIVVIACVWGWFLMIVGVAYSGRATFALIAWGLCSFMGVHLNVALARHQARWVPGRLQGRVSGISRVMTGGAMSLGAMGSGYVISWLQPERAGALVPLPFGAVAAATTVLLFTPDWLPLLRVFAIPYLRELVRPPTRRPGSERPLPVHVAGRS